MNRGRKTSPPPFYWKVPVPEEKQKDYMTENYRRMRSIAADGQKKRNGPLKANFIPGVTKNTKYDHIQSKVGELLKEQSTPQLKSCSDELINPKLRQSQSRLSQGGMSQGHGSVGGSTLGPRRLSRSSHDLRAQTGHEPQTGYNHRQPRRDVSVSASNIQSQRPAGISRSQPEVPGVKILQPNPPDESVFKWKFNNENPPLITNNRTNNSENDVKYPQPHCHRVEYLECDGICAEEAVDDTNMDSARSSSSRTSRGCNTEETRIINSSSNTPFRYRSLSFGNEVRNDRGTQEEITNKNNQIPPPQPQPPKQRGVFTLNGTTGSFPGNLSTMIRNRSSQNFNIITGNELESNMKSLRIRDAQKVLPKAANGNSNLNNLGAGDLPHTLGTVPRYLKQRQEEWRVEECAKKEAENNAHIPPGYMLMSETQRIENMKTFKKNYDNLIAELNRLPIRIDTIRVRDHRVQLEKQLTRLEEAMKTFSRPNVWVKMDD